MKRLLYSIVCLIFVAVVFGQQPATYFTSPVEIPILLAGNVGEIRPNHFHAGIDIKTDGMIGKKILSAADGYVSRISVSPVGYGKALYVNHPNGTTTVYGHLDRFNDQIDEYVRNEQYRRNSFALDISVPSHLFRVKQGDLIAWSGNSGSSGGPHLHFEIREQATQDVLNIMAKKLVENISDSHPPQFFKISVIGIDEVKGVPVHTLKKTYDVVKSGNEYRIEGNPVVPLPASAYFAVEVIDGKNGTSNIYGIYSMVQTVGGEQNFSYYIDRFDFATTRYINTLVYYPLHRQSRNEVIRTYVSPNNRLSIYKGVRNRGIVCLSGEEKTEITIAITDDNMNESVLRFDAVLRAEPAPDPDNYPGEPAFYDKETILYHEGLKVEIPPLALYESIILYTDTLAKRVSQAYSPVYRIHNDDTPMQKAMTVNIRPDQLPERLREKACLASVNARGKIIYEGGGWQGGTVSCTTRTFGDYFVTIDTIPPYFTPQFNDGADLQGQAKLVLKMTDNLSGIDNWSVTIDGQWALFDHDAKTSSLTHLFAHARYERGKKHSLVATATDGKGNRRRFETTFFW